MVTKRIFSLMTVNFIGTLMGWKKQVSCDGL
jgi:hypothetical protein